MTLMSVDDEHEQDEDDFRARPRWSANKKIDVVMRLLRGEALEDVSRDVRVEAHRLAAWRDDFIESGKARLKSKRPAAESDQRLAEAERKVGELTMDNGLRALRCGAV